MKTIGRLQFRHFSETFESREAAYKYLSDIVDITKGDDYRLDESRIGEPILVKYKDENGNIQALLSIGLEGEKDEGVLSPYHIIDSAKLEEEIQSISSSTSDIEQELREEIARAIEEEKALQSEINATQTGAGLEDNGSYVPESTATYVSDATSLKDADTKLDEELARVEKARKDVTGQETDEYVPNQSLTERPISYIADAESLNDADIKLDKAIQDLSSETVKNVAVDGVSGVVTENIAVISISADTIPIGPFEEYAGRATTPHPIHDDYSVLEAIKQVDTNFVEFVGTVNGKVQELSGNVQTLSASTKTFSANTVSEISRVDEKINNEATRATTAENSISANVATLSSTTKFFSAATIAEIARINATATRNKVKSTGNTIVVTEATEGTNLDVNIDSKTILSNNGELKTGLKVMPLAAGELESNVREAFRLVDNEGRPVDGTTIKIYKSSSLVSVELIKVDDIDYVRITYIDNEGTTKTMDLNIQQLIFEAEFKDGLVVNENGEVSVKIDPTSEAFLTVSSEGIKVSGLQNAINKAVADEAARATAAEDSISANVTTLSSTTEAFSGATVAKFELMESGWNVPGSIKHTIEDAFIKSVAVGSSEDSNKTLMRYYNDGDEHKYYVSSNAIDMYYNGLPLSTVIKNIEDENTQSSSAIDELSAATISEVARLDGRIDDETTRATAAENSISGTVNTLSAATESEIKRIEDKLSDNERVTSEAINQLKDELDRTEEGAGLNEDGRYHKHNTVGDMANYITNATSLDDADMMLDSALKAESDRAIASEESISGIVNTFSATTESTIRGLQEQLTEANSIIETLRTEIQTLSGVVETIESQMAVNIYSTVKTMLQGASRQIKVTPDDASKQINIGFADDAIFGQ